MKIENLKLKIENFQRGNGARTALGRKAPLHFEIFNFQFSMENLFHAGTP
jgi:hypothetical protein